MSVYVRMLLQTLQHKCMCRQRWENIQDICYVLMCYISWNCGEMSLFSFVLLEREIGEECVVCALFTLATQNMKWVKRRKPNYVDLLPFSLLLHLFFLFCTLLCVLVLSDLPSHCGSLPLAHSYLRYAVGWCDRKCNIRRKTTTPSSIAILGRQGLKESNKQETYLLSSHFLFSLRELRKKDRSSFRTATDISDHFSSFLWFFFLYYHCL